VCEKVKGKAGMAAAVAVAVGRNGKELL